MLFAGCGVVRSSELASRLGPLSSQPLMNAVRTFLRSLRSVPRFAVLAVLWSGFGEPNARALHQDEKPAAFGFDQVAAIAKEAATRPYSRPSEDLPAPLANLGYDQYRDIRFHPAAALFHPEGLPFEIQLFHRGYLYRAPVVLHVVENGVASLVAYRGESFEFGPSVAPTLKDAGLPTDLGFAGFRVHCALNRDDYKDELGVFLGASYFRMLSRNQVYGISARGLAVNTAEPEGEEFPSFREFWIEKPAADAKQLRVQAWLDSKSLSGAYEFTFEPGDASVVRVRVKLFARATVAKLGIAPLTSMFLFGEDRVRRPADFRPEVHDSDSLLVAAKDGSWIFRPLRNPERTHRVSRFDASGARGFGLLQRDREFRDYQDIESRFEKRPSLWVVPEHGFENGAVELVEIPTDLEIHDNIVAYFVPQDVLREGESAEFSYAVVAPSGDPVDEPADEKNLRVDSTRVHARGAGDASLFVIEFRDPRGLASKSDDVRPAPTARVTSSRGKVSEIVVQRNEAAGTWRLAFDWTGDSGEVDLTARLLVGDAAVSETWVYSYVTP